MKQTNTCPKCKSTSVIRIKPFKGTSTSNIIQLTKWGTKGTYFERYICTSCGFIEQYIDTQDKTWLSWLDEQIREKEVDSDFV